MKKTFTREKITKKNAMTAELKSYPKNVRIISEDLYVGEGCEQPGMMIYIDCSGKREFLMVSKNNSYLRSILHTGIKVSDLYRLKPKGEDKAQTDTMFKTLNHLKKAVKEYLSPSIEKELILS